MQCICVPLAVFAHSSFFAVRLTPCSHVSSNNSQGRDYFVFAQTGGYFSRGGYYWRKYGTPTSVYNIRHGVCLFC